MIKTRAGETAGKGPAVTVFLDKAVRDAPRKNAFYEHPLYYFLLTGAGSVTAIK